MRIFTTCLTTFVFALLSGGVTGTAFAAYGDRILQTASARTLGFGQVLPDLKGVSFIFVGEQHSDIRHHELQLRVLRSLYNLGIPVAVGLETFTARDQDQLDLWVEGTLLEEKFINAHEDNWGDTWELYSAIYGYAREKGIPLIGLNVPKEITTQVARRGFSSLSPEQRSQLPAVSCNVNEKYMSFIKMALSAHGPSENDRKFESFCEAQLVWDLAMASRLVRYIQDHPGVTVVVIAGNSHSWKPGIPEQLSRFGEGLGYRTILPEVPPVQTRHSIDRSIADYLWLLE